MAQQPSALKHLVTLVSPEKLYRVLKRNRCLTEEARRNPAPIIRMIETIGEEKRARLAQEAERRRQHAAPEPMMLGGSTAADEIANALFPYLNQRGNAMFYQENSLSRWQIFKYRYF